MSCWFTGNAAKDTHEGLPRFTAILTGLASLAKWHSCSPYRPLPPSPPPSLFLSAHPRPLFISTTCPPTTGNTPCTRGRNISTQSEPTCTVLKCFQQCFPFCSLVWYWLESTIIEMLCVCLCVDRSFEERAATQDSAVWQSYHSSERWCVKPQMQVCNTPVYVNAKYSSTSIFLEYLLLHYISEENIIPFYSTTFISM